MMCRRAERKVQVVEHKDNLQDSLKLILIYLRKKEELKRRSFLKDKDSAWKIFEKKL